jgi:alkaline phosphatase D
MKSTCRLPLAVCLLLFSLAWPAAAADLRAGPMAGASYMRGVKLWVQASGPAKAVIEYWDSNQPGKVLRTAPLALQQQDDYVAHFSIGALEPGRTYGYRVRFDGKEQKVPQSLTFRTQALWQWRGDAPDWKLAFGTCAYTNEVAYDRPGTPYGGPPEAMQIYDRIASQKPDMMLWGGDYLYHREADWDSESGLRYRWMRERGIPQVQGLLRTGHHFAIWDDHEYGPNDANSSYPLKGESLKLFKRYFANPGYGLPETPGVFGNFIFNDAEFFLTDNRYYRDSDTLIAEDKSMLGAAQLRWLKNALLASVSPVKIIVVGSQVTNSVNTMEGWDKFPKERADLLKFLVDQKIGGVMIFSGDRHFTEMLRTERAGTYPLYELTCSSLTSGGPSSLYAEQDNPQVVADTFVPERNFCTVDFSGPRQERKLTLRSFSAEGRRLWEKEIAVSALQLPK